MLNNHNHKVCFGTMDVPLDFNCSTDFTWVITFCINGLHSNNENTNLLGF